MINAQGLYREGALGPPLHAPHVAAMWRHNTACPLRQPSEVHHRGQIHQNAAPLMPMDDLTQICMLPHPSHYRMLQSMLDVFIEARCLCP